MIYLLLIQGLKYMILSILEHCLFSDSDKNYMYFLPQFSHCSVQALAGFFVCFAPFSHIHNSALFVCFDSLCPINNLSVM